MKVHVGEVPDVKPVFVAVVYQLCDSPVLVTEDLQEYEPVEPDEPERSRNELSILLTTLLNHLLTP